MGASVMNWSLRLGHVNGAPVEIHWLFGLLLAWTAYAGWSQAYWLGLVYTTSLLLVTFACVLLHEIGHTVAAQAIGLPVRRIVLLPFGGLAQLAHAPEHAIDELRVAAAGPVVNLGLSLVCGSLLVLWLMGSGTPLPSWQRLGYEITRGQPGGIHFLASLTFVNAGLVGSLVVLERSHPAVPNIEKGAIVVTHIGMVVVMMGDVVESFKHPVTRQPAWDHFVAGVASDVDHRIVG